MKHEAWRSTIEYRNRNIQRQRYYFSCAIDNNRTIHTIIHHVSSKERYELVVTNTEVRTYLQSLLGYLPHISSAAAPSVSDQQSQSIMHMQSTAPIHHLGPSTQLLSIALSQLGQCSAFLCHQSPQSNIDILESTVTLHYIV